jgi:hypothetical protein
VYIKCCEKSFKLSLGLVSDISISDKINTSRISYNDVVSYTSNVHSCTKKVSRETLLEKRGGGGE